MKFFLGATISLFPFLCFGVLPPLYDSLTQFKSLINDERLPISLDSSEAIVDIRKEDGFFVVTTNKQMLKVKIVREPNQVIGPSKFHLEFPKDETKQ